MICRCWTQRVTRYIVQLNRNSESGTPVVARYTPTTFRRGQVYFFFIHSFIQQRLFAKYYLEKLAMGSMDSCSGAPFDVAIVGGGIAGMIVALGLLSRGIPVK